MGSQAHDKGQTRYNSYYICVMLSTLRAVPGASFTLVMPFARCRKCIDDTA